MLENTVESRTRLENIKEELEFALEREKEASALSRIEALEASLKALD